MKNTVFETIMYGYQTGGGGRLNLTGTDPQVVGTELERLKQDHNGRLFPPDVVDAARDERSPLHPIFEWDDTIAAKRFRLEQARSLIKVVVIESKGSVRLDHPVSAFVNVSILDTAPSTQKPEGNDQPKTVRYYESTVVAMNNPELRDQVLRKAMAEVESWRERYAAYKEFSDIFEAIDATKSKYVAKL